MRVSNIELQQHLFFGYRHTDSNTLNLLPAVSSIDNYFVPLFAGTTGLLVTKDIHKSVIYNLKLHLGDNVPFPRTMRSFVKYLHEYKNFSFLSSNNIRYYGMKHCLFTYDNEEINLLYCLCIPRPEFFDFGRARLNIDYKKLFLIINESVISSSHSLIAPKIKAMIKLFSGLGVNIIYTKDPKSLIFNSIESPQRFRTMNDRVNFIEETKNRLGLYVQRRPESQPEGESISQWG